MTRAEQEHDEELFNAGRNQGLLKAKDDFIKMIDERIEIIKEEKTKWELTDKHNIEKGYFRNPDFGKQADAKVFELEELKQKISKEIKDEK